MQESFIDSTVREGQARIGEYVLGWLERLDYAGKLDRAWPEEELAAVVWGRIERDFGAHWDGPVVTNRALAEVVATVMVEDYFASYPRRRASRYSVGGPLPDAGFRRCVLDFIHDLEEFAPAELPPRPETAAEVFWAEVRENPHRWGCSPGKGPFVDDEPRAREVAVEAIREYFHLRERVEEQRREDAA
jgi:hypothetical protein